VKMLAAAVAMAGLALAACTSQPSSSRPSGAAPLGSEPPAPTSAAPIASASSAPSPKPWKAAICEPGSAANWSRCCLVHEVELPNYDFSRACSVPEEPTPLWPAGSYPAESEWAGRIVRDADAIPSLAWTLERHRETPWDVQLIGKNTTAGELVIALDGMIFPRKGNRPLVFYVKGIVAGQDQKPVPFDLRIVRSVDWP
jgi:hypothetical protein